MKNQTPARIESNRAKREHTKARLINAALIQARTPGGWQSLKRAEVALAAEVAEGCINVHWGTMAVFKRAVMRAAIARGDDRVIAQGAIAGDANVLKLPTARIAAAMGVMLAECSQDD